MYNPPRTPPRPFEADYPAGAPSDAEGNLSVDVVPVGGTREVGAQPALVRHDDYTVAGDAHIEFQGVDSHGQGVGEGGERVLGAQRTAAAMGFDVERCSQAGQ